MTYRNSHLSDHDLILAADGELPRLSTAEIEAHLNSCGACRARRQAMQEAIGNFVHAYRGTIDSQSAPSRILRARFKARLSRLAAERPQTPGGRLRPFGLIGRRAV
jgi:anti-sigma factor RsiW